MTDLTREQLEALLDGATQGPWQADGEPWNRIVWSSAENRVCFMAHSNGLDDARDIATSNLVAAAPDIARQLLATMTERDEAQAAQAGVVEKIRDHANKAFVHVYDTAGRMLINKHTIIDCLDDIALAAPTGVKLLAELRSERDELRRENGILRGNAKAQGLVDEIGATGKNRRKTEGKLARTIEGQRAALRKLQGVVERHKTRAEAAEAQLAEAQKREARMREALAGIAAYSDMDHREFQRRWPDLHEKIVAERDHECPARDYILSQYAVAALSAAPTGEESNG